ncbi:hypothetical protein [Haliscomenobacter sp.]|uniref:hypothetical protein n=1 Tax=Haliscomenobacter sp. TaxID=2717303 RepID=UPI003BA91827
MNKFWKALLSTALLVGTTDILAATLMSWARSGNFPFKLLHYIAGGALGLERSMKGSWGTALLGLSFHYFIAVSFTLLFFLAFPRLSFLRGNVYLTGFLYGVFVGACMTFIVLPLTALPPNPFKLLNALQGWTVLGLVLGIPIALMAKRYYLSKLIA